MLATTDRDAFLAAILADPADSLVRLAYADWLDEQDDRAPCEHCRALPEWADPDLKARVDELMSGGAFGDGIGPGNTAKRINAETGRAYTPEAIHAVWQRGKDWFVKKCEHCAGGSVPAGNAARAEFIRVGVELAKWGEPPYGWCGEYAVNMRKGEKCGRCPDCRTTSHLRARESALLASHGTHWLKAAGITPTGQDGNRFAGYLTPGGPVVYDVRFGRGFVETVTVPRMDEFVGDRVCGKCVKGWVWTGDLDGETGHRIETPCPSCGGLGRVRACEACRGDGTYLGMPRSSNPGLCSRCSGSGTLPPLAPMLARVPGITEVWCQDREPYPVLGDNVFAWFNGQYQYAAGNNGADIIPEPLYGLLDGHVRSGELAKHYPTAALALQSLALAGGGLLAGLGKGLSA